MKKFYLFLSLFLIINTNQLQAQNDSIYFWKTGALLEKRSIKTADLDSITFKRPLLTTVTICNQVWATKNLNVSTFRNGDIIPQVTGSFQWRAITGPAWCYYNNDPATEIVYGKLYNWYAVNDPRGLAPSGYHIPSDAEWTTLTTCLGGITVAGGKMKEIGTAHWTSPNTSATNSSGFTARPGGYRYTYGDPNVSGGSAGSACSGINSDGFWWSSTAVYTMTASGYKLNYNNSSLIGSGQLYFYGLSVRCIKD